jgi:competence protein ComEC
MAEEVLIPYLRKKRIYHLDYLIASHGDYDHIGAKDSLLKNFSVGKFIDSTESFPLTFGNVTLTNYNHYKASDENEKSLVLGMDFMDKKWLFMGDAPMEIEEEIIKDYPTLDCDILKAGHHGSKTSSSLDFLKTVTPDTAIISVGYKNHYGHPDKEVIARLESLNIEIRRTDVEGTITYQKFVMPKL